MVNDIVEQLVRVVWAVRVGVSLAQWLPWMLLAVVALVAAAVGWFARGERAVRSESGLISFNPATGFYEYTSGGKLREFVFAPERAGVVEGAATASESDDGMTQISRNGSPS